MSEGPEGFEDAARALLDTALTHDVDRTERVLAPLDGKTLQHLSYMFVDIVMAIRERRHATNSYSR